MEESTLENMADNSLTSDDVPAISDKIDEAKEQLDRMEGKLDKDISARKINEEKQRIHDRDMETIDKFADNQHALSLELLNLLRRGTDFSSHGIREINKSGVNPEDVDIQEYDLADSGQFASFGAKFKAGEHFAFAVVLCVFEYVELDDLQNLKSKMMDELPKVTDEEGKEIAVYHNPYLPISSLLKTVKGKMFTTDSGDNCVGLGDSRPTALKNLWEQFPMLRGNISRWLLTVSDIFEYRTNFDTLQVANAFINLLKLDYNAGIRHIFPRLYSSPDKSWLLGIIAFSLYSDPAYKKKLLPILTDWASSSSRWLWKPALYVYIGMRDDEVDSEFVTAVKKSLVNKFRGFRFSDLRYISLFLIGCERLRTLTTQIFTKLYSMIRVYDEKIGLAVIYLECVRFAYFTVSGEYPALPLVACDTKKQQVDILPLVEVALHRHSTRRMLFSILEAYLKEISKYDVEEKVIKHLKAYFVVLADNNPTYMNDILTFLEKCRCTVADSIRDSIKSKQKILALGGNENE